MIAFKCSKCGFVGARDRATCKRCGTPISPVAQKQSSSTHRWVILAGSIAVGMVVVFVGSVIVIAMLGLRKPSPSEVGSMLSAEDSFKQPINLSLPAELRVTLTHDQGSKESFIQNYAEGRVFRQLGLVTTDFRVTKAEQQKCWRYDWATRAPQFQRYNPMPSPDDDGVHYKVANPNGEFSECKDAWDYYTKFTFDDLANIDSASMTDRVQYVTDINDQPPPQVRAVIQKDTSAGWVSFPMGTIEIVEVSDVLDATKPGTYTVGFRFRFKPNTLGELYDVNSSIHKSLPQTVRWLFAGILKIDKRFQNPPANPLEQNKGVGNGMGFGHADLAREGMFGRWTIRQIYFDGVDEAREKYSFHQVK